jgi:hypothetical protein
MQSPQFEFDAEAGDALEVAITDFGEVNFVAMFLVAEQDRDQLTKWQEGKSPTSFDFPADMAVLTREAADRTFTIRAAGRWLVAARLPGGSVAATLVTKDGERRPIERNAF